MLNPMDNADFLRVVFDGPTEPQQKPLAMAFIQNQKQLNLMDVNDEFKTGTIFKDLDKPFMPWGDK
ncbi:MAG: spore coat associated protein CotJA [Clostridia bacterium]|nr:spore coat associated protein CotJA [Clostridia bacterium]